MSPQVRVERGWFVHPVPVRFRDLDALGHAHHTLPLIYLEEARAVLWSAIKGSDAVEAIDYVIAEVTVRFLARVWFPSTLNVALAVSRVGERSFTLLFEIRSEAGEVYSRGSAVHVAYDYAAGASRPLDRQERRALERLHGFYQKNIEMVADSNPIIAPST